MMDLRIKSKSNQSDSDNRRDYFFKTIKKLTIIAMFSDDDLLNRLVLKGGNALDIVYRLNSRSSIDVDFSMEEEFRPDEIDEIN